MFRWQAVGAVGCITDGGVRDLQVDHAGYAVYCPDRVVQEMKNIGFHAMSRGVTVSHSFGVCSCSQYAVQLLVWRRLEFYQSFPLSKRPESPRRAV